MFSFLAGFDKILVTGPQRSGTTICAKMIAGDLGYGHIDEVVFGAYDFNFVFKTITGKDKVVLQCPCHCVDIHKLGDRSDVAVVVMLRDRASIVASQDRIGWTVAYEPAELARYGINKATPGLRISDVKYANWYGWQKAKVCNPFELEYSTLRDHPLWLDKEKRVGFESKQTKVS